MDRLARHVRAMARNNLWANEKLLRACEALAPGEFTAARTGFFPSLAATLDHLHAVDLYYLDALERGGRGRAVYDRAPFAEAAALRQAQAAVDARLVAFCDRLDGDALDARVPTERGAAGIVAERVDALLAHLFQHQIHHRGQAHAMLSGTSVAPPQLDEFFLDYDRDPAAAALWP